MSHFLGLWLVENIIVIKVEVDELHEGKILSRPSTSMTISAVAQENKKNNERLSWAVPHSKINQTKNCPLLQYNRGPIMRQGGHMLQQENKGNNKRLNWTVPHSEPNPKQKNVPSPKFTYSGRICRFAQFFTHTLHFDNYHPAGHGDFEFEKNQHFHENFIFRRKFQSRT